MITISIIIYRYYLVTYERDKVEVEGEENPKESLPDSIDDKVLHSPELNDIQPQENEE